MNYNKWINGCQTYASIINSNYDYDNFGNTKDDVRNILMDDIEDEILELAEVDRYIIDEDEDEVKRNNFNDFTEDEQESIMDVIDEVVSYLDLPNTTPNDEGDDDDE